MIRLAGKTHQGKRPYNEDCLIADATRCIAIVADGMGGHEAGEVASELAVNTVCTCIDQGSSLKDSVLAAHREIILAAHDGRGKPGMGTTVAIAHLHNRLYSISWVGDSRVYLWNGELLQLTRDHSYLEALIARGALNPEDAAQSAHRNLVTQALGVEEIKSLDVKVIQGELGSGEQLLVCSDGLNDELSGVEIARIMAMDLTLEDKVDELISQAIIAGGRDNVTAVVLEFDSPGSKFPGRPPPSPVSVVGRDGVERFAPVHRRLPPIDDDKEAERRAIAFAGKAAGSVGQKKQPYVNPIWWAASIGLLILGVIVVQFM